MAGLAPALAMEEMLPVCLLPLLHAAALPPVLPSP
jgi:hypothetical protein